MRALITALLVLTAASLCHAADLTIVRVWPGHRTAESFERISEYFGKDEQPTQHHIFRTQPGERTGYYFLVRLNNPAAEMADARVEVKLVTPFSTEPKTFTFDCALPRGSQAFHFGLTGSDWPGQPKDEAIAWQVRVLSSAGNELARAQSFLWAMPAKK